MNGDLRLYWRHGGDWDVAAYQAAFDEHDAYLLLLAVLKNVIAGRECCGGCRRVFNHTREVALITEWWASTRTWPPEPCMVAYCLPCAQAHADDIADLSQRGVTQ